MTPQTFGSVCHGQRVFPSWMYPSGTLGSIDAYSSGIKWRTFCAIDCLLQDAIQMCPTVWNIHKDMVQREDQCCSLTLFFSPFLLCPFSLLLPVGNELKRLCYEVRKSSWAAAFEGHLPAFGCVFQTLESSFKPRFIVSSCSTHEHWGGACC